MFTLPEELWEIFLKRRELLRQCKKIPERIIKLVSACVFIFFGFLGSFQVAKEKLN